MGPLAYKVIYFWYLRTIAYCFVISMFTRYDENETILWCYLTEELLKYNLFNIYGNRTAVQIYLQFSLNYVFIITKSVNIVFKIKLFNLKMLQNFSYVNYLNSYFFLNVNTKRLFRGWNSCQLIRFAFNNC